ncbi:MAG: dephospho-CoA kinase [Clostridiales bacterium]|nr:dephospho-CoA kinase [Clostridiales bacterium]
MYNRLIRAAAHRVVVLEETVPPRFSGGFVLGITGPTGAGKTYVCNLLADMGFYHCDTDRISRQVTQRGSPILADLAQTFGADILQSDGSLDRRLLARRAFQDPLEEQKLNAIVHPEVLRRVEKIIVERIQAGATKIVLDVPLLFESGADRLCDRTLAVLCDKMKRLHRIMVRDNLSKDQALLRMNIQPGDDFYQERADAVIHNNGRHQIEARIQDILEEWL